MKHTIECAPGYALLTAHLDPGERIKAEPGAIVSQQGVTMSTTGRRGIVKGFRQILGGESFFINTFEADQPGATINLAPATPGDIGEFILEPQSEISIQSGSFLACTDNTELDTKFQGLKAFFTGESFFFIRAYTKDR